MPASTTLSTLLCLVISVQDGDSLMVRCATSVQTPVMKVRIAAIDAPERRQAYGQRSRQQLVQLCLRQQAVLHTVARDDYGRTVAHVRCNGQDVATSQVRSGMAWAYVRYAASQPELIALEHQARAQRIGLWSQARPTPPWDYRRRHTKKD